MRVLLLAAISLILAVTVLSNPIPNPVMISGTYMMHTYEDGSFSESWKTSGAHLEVGNTFYSRAKSVLCACDGQPYTDEVNGVYRITCPVVSTAPTLISDDRDENGTGYVYWTSNYASGQIILSHAGPWTNDNDLYFYGILSEFNVTYTYLYLEGDLFSRSGYITAEGWGIDGNGKDIVVDIESQIAIDSDTYSQPLPEGYPDFSDPDCIPGVRTEGCFGQVSFTKLTIEKKIPTEDTTWGRVKQIFKN